MIYLIAWLLFAIFLFLSGIHFYWGLGGKWGAEASIPSKENHEKVFNPKLFECFVVGFGLLGFGLFVLVKSTILPFELPVFLADYGLWFVSILFILRSVGEFYYIGFFKKIKNTKFGQMDSKYYSPLCLFIGFLGIILTILT